MWLGTGLGFFVCLVVAGGLIGAFYTLGTDRWSGSEDNFEGAFCLIASVIITFVGAALLRVGKMQKKWRIKLATAIEAPIGKAGGIWGRTKRASEKYVMFVLPFVTVLREGIEAIVFVAGEMAPSSSSPPAGVVLMSSLARRVLPGVRHFGSPGCHRRPDSGHHRRLYHIQGRLQHEAAGLPGYLHLPALPDCRRALLAGRLGVRAAEVELGRRGATPPRWATARAPMISTRASGTSTAARPRW